MMTNHGPDISINLIISPTFILYNFIFVTITALSHVRYPFGHGGNKNQNFLILIEY